MTRFLSALALCVALPAQALPIDMSLPNLTFPDTVTTPSTKGCEAAPKADTCPAQE